MKTFMRMCAALGAFFVVAIGIAACGSSNSSSSTGLSGNANVAVVAGNPITRTAFNHWMYIAEKGNAAEEEGSPVIVPTDPPNFTGCIAQVRAQIPSLKSTKAATLKQDCAQLFQSLAGQVLDFLIKGYWYQAQGYAQGIRVSQAQVNKAFAAAKKQSFPTAAEYKAFLAQTGETEQDVYFRLRVNAVFSKLLAKVTPSTNAAAIKSYYNAHSSEFGTPETRNLLLIRANSQAVAKKALTALKSGQSWAAVAKKYSVDTATKNNGGVLTGITNGEEEQALNTVAFSAPLKKVEGPIHGEFGFYLVEVTKITKGTHETLAKATPEIKEIIQSQSQTTAENKVNAAVMKAWKSKTKCASGYNVVNDCTNYVAPKTTTSTTAAGTSGAASSSSSGAATVTSSAGTATSSSGGSSTAASTGSSTASSTGTSTTK